MSELKSLAYSLTFLKILTSRAGNRDTQSNSKTIEPKYTMCLQQMHVLV